MPYGGVHYLWFAFVRFLIRSHSPPFANVWSLAVWAWIPLLHAPPLSFVRTGGVQRAYLHRPRRTLRLEEALWHPREPPPGALHTNACTAPLLGPASFMGTRALLRS